MSRLSEIQRKLRANKNQYNSFGKYSYRSCEDILEEIKKLLEEDEYIILKDEIVLIGDRYYIKATATFHKGLQSFHAEAFAREPESKKGMDESQITGSSSSYARKYALSGLFAIDDNKDADVTNMHDKEDNDEEEIIKEFLSKIESIDELKKFYEKNKNKYKGKLFFNSLVNEKKKQLEGVVNNENN